MIHFSDFSFMDYKPELFYKNKGKKNEEVYCNDIITLDTEVTSYYIHNNKAMTFDFSKEPEWYIKNTIPQSLMYIWMIGINETVVYGRTNEELNRFITQLTINIKAKTIIYVHNLGYDFNFLKNSIGTNCTVLARKEKKPMKIEYPAYNLEFRCSLFLTNKSLDAAAKEVFAPVKKLVGYLDYNIIRTPKTQLTEKELEYCEHDIICLYYIILDKLKKYRHIENIPLTQTGQVRRAFKAALYTEKEYKAAVKNMWPDYKQFKLLYEAFYGGYVHSNSTHTNKILKNVFSYDITSSYPYVLCTQKFPIKSFTESYEKNLNFLDFENYSYIMDITITNVECKLNNTFLSIHKALTLDFDGSKIEYILADDTKKHKIQNTVLDNGRIKTCEKARYILTDCDLIILNNAYNFNYTINNIYSAKKDYLPKKMIEFILKLFNDKTQYKGLDEFTSQYKEAKEFINSVYGMFVTKILADSIDFQHGQWFKELLTEEKAEEKLIELGNKDQFCSYSTGVWCATYARKHLWDVIVKMDRDVVYNDTDSIKFQNEYNFKFFDEDNINVDRAIANVCLARDLDPRAFKVQKPKGGIAKLGYFEAEEPYAEFKTLGAKKYAYILKGDKTKEVHITVAGVNKNTGAKYFRTLKDFAPATFLNYEYAGKKIVRYNENQKPFTFEDGYYASEKYGCVLTPTTYLLNITTDYNILLQELENDENFNVGEGTELL